MLIPVCGVIDGNTFLKKTVTARTVPRGFADAEAAENSLPGDGTGRAVTELIKQ